MSDFIVNNGEWFLVLFILLFSFRILIGVRNLNKSGKALTSQRLKQLILDKIADS
jgi:hypothetical protein